MGLLQLLVCHVRIAKAADTCGELRNRNGGLHGALQYLVARIAMHIFAEHVTQYRWPLGLGTHQYDFTKAVHTCGTLGNVREGATLSSETRNGEAKSITFLSCQKCKYM